MNIFKDFFEKNFRLNEGLIKTYPIDNLIKSIKNANFYNTYTLNKPPTKLGNESRIINITFVIYGDRRNISHISNDMKTLKNILTLHGFHIGAVSKYDKNYNKVDSDRMLYYYKISVEPKFTTKIKSDVNDLFHITYKRYFEKIQKHGLVPKESKSSFTHPGNRIYLLKTDDPKVLYSLAKAISKNRLNNIPDHIYIKGVAAVDFYKFSNTVDQMNIYKVDTQGLKLYEDPMVEPFDNTKAYYTTDNIPPNRLTLML